MAWFDGAQRARSRPLYMGPAACLEGGPTSLRPHDMNDITHRLHTPGQSLWFDSISRDLPRSGTLARYIADFSITGLTSNPTIFEPAIVHDDGYDDSIRRLDAAGQSAEELYFELALEDLTNAAELLRPAFDASLGAEGWVSLEVSPLLADNTAPTVHAASKLFERAARANLLIKIPGTPAGVRAVEGAVFDGVPVNVTLLFSREHYLAAAHACMRALERHLEAGLDLRVEAVASLFVSRWDTAVELEIAPPLHNRLGIAMAMRTCRDNYLDNFRTAGQRSLAAAAAAAVGRHRHQGRQRSRHAVRAGLGCRGHHQHVDREDAAGLGRPRPGRHAAAGRRRICRCRAGRVPPRGCGRCGAGRASAARRCGRLRAVVARDAELHPREVRLVACAGRVVTGAPVAPSEDHAGSGWLLSASAPMSSSGGGGIDVGVQPPPAVHSLGGRDD